MPFPLSPPRQVAKQVDMRALRSAMAAAVDTTCARKDGGRLSEAVATVARDGAGIRNVSFAYCFITLLHLANDRGLRLEQDAGDFADVHIHADAAPAR